MLPDDFTESSADQFVRKGLRIRKLSSLHVKHNFFYYLLIYTVKTGTHIHTMHIFLLDMYKTVH